MNWKEIALLAGGTAAAGVILYYLLKEDSPESDASRVSSEKRALNGVEMTKDEVLQVLSDIAASQERMKSIMKDLTQEISKNKHDFQKTYNRVRELQLDDPLGPYGLSMMEFDELLDKYHEDPTIYAAISRIMGSPGPMFEGGHGTNISPATLVAVHECMLKGLQSITDEFLRLPDHKNYDSKSATIAAQAIVSIAVEEEYGVTSEEIEAAVLTHHQSLSLNPEFSRINYQMQIEMGKLLGASN